MVMHSVRNRLRDLSDEQRERYEALLDSFESRWSTGAGVPPDLSDWLPEEEPLRALVLVALVKSDLEARRGRHLLASVQDYLARFPELGNDAHATSDLLAWQYQLFSSGGRAEALRHAGRNLLHEEIGSGGIGIVLRGHDPQLGRELAVKVLRPEHGDNPALVWRFLVEARILAQLEHPCVVPVHDSGQLADGRPYITMRLLRGQPLDRLLAARQNPQQDQGRLVTVFYHICQALAYAHQKAIIHRDLKPGNVMVGGFGEVQVLDWGFAKLLSGDGADATGAAGKGRIAATRQTRVDNTELGSNLGTWPYMPPEQARGLVGEVHQRSDVFGLGAILCEILTGQPPYVGRTLADVKRQARGPELQGAYARLEVCGADVELQTLARACLAAAPAERPHDAGVVAGQLEAYLVAAQARAEEARAITRAEAARVRVTRRARRLIGVLAAVGVVLDVAAMTLVKTVGDLIGWFSGAGLLLLVGWSLAGETIEKQRQSPARQADEKAPV
jgi:hypothetical protein